MITPKSGDANKVWVSFGDWDAHMYALASKIHMLPDPPGAPPFRNHDIGIDNLSKLPNGKRAIDLLFDLVDDLPYRPDADDVLRMGARLIAADAMLDRVVAQHKREHPPKPRPTIKKGKVPKTLAQTKRQLRDWDVLGQMLTARDPMTLSKGAVRAKYANFITTFYGVRNVLGQVILDYPGKARYWALAFMKPEFDIGEAIDPRVKTEEETHDVSQERPEKVAPWAFAWCCIDRHREEVDYCLANLKCLNAWEVDFMTTIAEKQSLSPRQVMTVQKIVNKVAKLKA